MMKQWYKTKEILHYKQLFCCDTKSKTEHLLNKFYLDFGDDGAITICFKNAMKITSNLLTFKDDKIIYKNLDAIINLTPRHQLVFSEVIKKHLTASINI